ncbi:MAG: class I SAM-dependent methyltransferase [Planctomycetota bacterium]|nr:MAG: class I SAM-dependent methyltransferase [Planctomycetota bacterium]
MTMETLQPAGVAGPDTATSPSPIGDYYDETVVDYGVWSREGYLHFGYWRPWLNPFSRKPMLEEMNRVVFRQLGLDHLPEGQIGDLGCGFGAVARFGSRLYPQLEFHAVTISPQQVAEAQRRHADERVHYYCADYHRLPLPDGALDGVYFLESLCHSTRPDEALAEAARVVRPGGRIVLTDGYITRPLHQTSALFQHVVKAVAHNWAVPMFHEIELARRWTGQGRLQLIDQFECGWRLGPSALHAAHLSAWHFCKLLLRRDVSAWQWKHLVGSAYTIALGLYRRYFRYHILTFQRNDRP